MKLFFVSVLTVLISQSGFSNWNLSQADLDLLNPGKAKSLKDPNVIYVEDRIDGIGIQVLQEEYYQGAYVLSRKKSGRPIKNAERFYYTADHAYSAGKVPCGWAKDKKAYPEIYECINLDVSQEKIPSNSLSPVSSLPRSVYDSCVRKGIDTISKVLDNDDTFYKILNHARAKENEIVDLQFAINIRLPAPNDPTRSNDMAPSSGSLQVASSKEKTLFIGLPMLLQENGTCSDRSVEEVKAGLLKGSITRAGNKLSIGDEAVLETRE